jgi:ADP-heptose:LPS heptosyltransferase
VAENWPLRPTVALIGQATVFVGHDSGLTHLAAAFRRPTVAIFGPTDPEVWGPRGEHVTIVPMARAWESRDWRGCSSWDLFQPAPRDLQLVLEAVQRGLATQTPRRSPSDRSAQS